MICLHGSWLYSDSSAKTRGFFLWAETDRSLDQSTRALPRLHPFSAAPRTLRRVLAELMPSAEFLVKRSAQEHTSTIWLPTRADAPQPSTPLLTHRDETTGPRLQLESWQVESLRFEPHDAPGLLATLPPDQEERPGV